MVCSSLVTWFDFDPDGGVASRHVQIFVPSVDRYGEAIPKGQEYWVDEGLMVLGKLFGGATAFPPARGVWYDDERDQLVYDETVVVFSYAAESDLTMDAAEALHDYLMRLGMEGRQGEVGVFLDGEYHRFRKFGAS